MIFLSALGIVLAIVLSLNVFEAILASEWVEAAGSAVIATTLFVLSQIIVEKRNSA